MSGEVIGAGGAGPTVGERLDLLNKMINTLDQVTLKVNENTSALKTQEVALQEFQRFWLAQEQNIRTAINALQAGTETADESLQQRKIEFERLRREMETSVNSFNISVKAVSDRVDTIKDVIDTLKNAVKDVPSMESIRNVMADETSPLVTKSDFSQASEKIASLDGKLSVLLVLVVSSVALPLLRWLETVISAPPK